MTTFAKRSIHTLRAAIALLLANCGIPAWGQHSIVADVNIGATPANCIVRHVPRGTASSPLNAPIMVYYETDDEHIFAIGSPGAGLVAVAIKNDIHVTDFAVLPNDTVVFCGNTDGQDGVFGMFHIASLLGTTMSYQAHRELPAPAGRHVAALNKMACFLDAANVWHVAAIGQTDAGAHCMAHLTDLFATAIKYTVASSTLHSSGTWETFEDIAAIREHVVVKGHATHNNSSTEPTFRVLTKSRMLIPAGTQDSLFIANGDSTLSFALAKGMVANYGMQKFTAWDLVDIQGATPSRAVLQYMMVVDNIYSPTIQLLGMGGLAIPQPNTPSGTHVKDCRQHNRVTYYWLQDYHGNGMNGTENVVFRNDDRSAQPLAARYMKGYDPQSLDMRPDEMGYCTVGPLVEHPDMLRIVFQETNDHTYSNGQYTVNPSCLNVDSSTSYTRNGISFQRIPFALSYHATPIMLTAEQAAGRRRLPATTTCIR